MHPTLRTLHARLLAPFFLVLLLVALTVSAAEKSSGQPNADQKKDEEDPGTAARRRARALAGLGSSEQKKVTPNGTTNVGGAGPFEVAFPDDSGIVDIVKQYGAKGDGVTDDTDALQKAFSEHLDYHARLLYLRNGTYLISRQLASRRANGTMHFGTRLTGQHRDKVIIKLKDQCPGFQDPTKPQAVLRTGSRDQEDGGNMAHYNSFFNLTVDTGSGNPGAIGIDYLASNNGAMRDVTVRSGDGAGVCGVSMLRAWPGPCLLKNIRIEGFDYGIQIGHGLYSVTFEHIFLEKQRLCGFQNRGNIVCMRGLRSQNAVPAYESKGGLTVLLDSELNSNAALPAAIENQRGFLYVRNLRVGGYQSAIKDGKLIPGPLVPEYCSDNTVGLFPSPERTLNLPIEETPELPYDPPDQWARGSGGGIQRAIDSGKTTIYIPFQDVHVKEPIIIRGNVRRIVGMYSNCWKAKDAPPGPCFRYEGTTSKVVVMEYFMSGTVEHACPDTLVFRHGAMSFTNAPGAGRLFIEDDCCGPIDLKHPMQVWARHLNQENPDFNFRNNGGRVWILGFKSEREGIQFETTNGGWTEVLGGLVYPCHAVPYERPMIVNHESNVSAVLRQLSFIKDGLHRIRVRETRDGVTKDLANLPEQFYVGYKAPPPAEWNVAADGAQSARDEAKSNKEAAQVAPIRRQGATAEILATWDAKLKARVLEDLAAKRKTDFLLASMKMQVAIVALQESGALRLLSQGLEVPSHWEKLSLEEKRNLAVAFARTGEQPDLLLAVFYCLAMGSQDQAEKYMQRVAQSEELKEVLAALQME